MVSIHYPGDVHRLRSVSGVGLLLMIYQLGGIGVIQCVICVGIVMKSTGGYLMLTPIKQAIITFIKAFSDTNGYQPTLHEIGAGVHLSKTAVAYHVDCLCDVGVLSRKRNSPRSITVNDAR